MRPGAISLLGPHLEANLLCGVVRLVTGVSAHGSLPADAGTRPLVFFANHSSHLDAVVVWMSLPPSLRARTRPVAARDYWEGGRVRRHFACTILNALLIARAHGNHSQPSLRAATEGLEAMVAALEAGFSLILFPEGTRATGEQMGHFKSGLYQLARRAPGARFVPAYLENLNRILPKGEWLPVPMLGAIRFGPPLTLEAEESRAAFLERSEAALRALKEANA